MSRCRLRDSRPILAVVALSSAALTLVLAGASPSRAAIAFSQDFESGLGPNETTSGSFQINNTNAPINNGTRMMGHASNYASNEYTYYEVRLNLSGFQQTRLQFDFRAQIYTHFDRFN